MTDERWTDEREIAIDADPESVWAAWARPEHVRRWFSDDAWGTVEEGGELIHRFDGFGEHRYRVVEVDEPRRLVLEGGEGERAFRQEVEIRSRGGRTVLRLVHSGFGPRDSDSETAKGMDSGWTMALAMLKRYVERYLGRDKKTVAAFRPARFEYLRLRDGHFLTARGLGSWLTDGSAGIAAGGKIDLTLRGGRSLTGEVLALTGQEVAVSWHEVDGVLELKAFGNGPESRMLGVRLMTWSDDEALAGQLEAELNEAADRLAEAMRA